MKALIFLCVVTGAALVYLMSEASSNNALFAQNYTLLLGLGGGLALGLMALIGYQLMVLRKKLRDRVFGSKLTKRLMLVFALMALIPGGLVYAISYQFLQRSIESWFNVRVDDGTDAGQVARGATPVVQTGGHYRLNEAAGVAVDLVRFKTLISDGEHAERAHDP